MSTDTEHPTAAEEVTSDVHDPADIDWGELWSEFGFDTEDAVGSIVISETQLIGAIESSEQEIGCDPEKARDWGVDDGVLVAKDDDSGYIWEGMLE